MDIKNRRLIITCLVVGLVACLCIAGVAVLAAGYFYTQGDTDLLSAVTCASFPDRPNTTDTSTQLDQIEEQIIDLRGLQPSIDVQRGFMTPPKLRQHVTEDFFKDYSTEEAEHDARVLTILGLLEPDFDLITFYTDLYSEQIAGFYDQETKEMYVIQDDQFGGPERMTYAHEYVHALQDQNYDMENGLKLNDEACEDDSERCAAVSALIEGDATLTENNWYQANATRQDCREVTTFYSSLQSPVYDSAPEFMKQDFLFPYLQGGDFVQALIDRDGEKAVDEAFLDPPVSTEQILHPESYPADQPIAVSLPDLSSVLDAGWQEIDRGVIGEWYTYLVLAHAIDPAHRLETKAASEAAAGWGGDAYVVYLNADQDQTVLVIQTIWDGQSDAQQFNQSFHDYARLRFGQNTGTGSSTWIDEQNDQSVNYFLQQDSTTTWIQAPDAVILASLKAALHLPPE